MCREDPRRPEGRSTRAKALRRGLQPAWARSAARARARATLYLPSLRASPRPIAIPATRVAASTARETSYTIIEVTA